MFCLHRSHRHVLLAPMCAPNQPQSFFSHVGLRTKAAPLELITLVWHTRVWVLCNFQVPKCGMLSILGKLGQQAIVETWWVGWHWLLRNHVAIRGYRLQWLGVEFPLATVHFSLLGLTAGTGVCTVAQIEVKNARGALWIVMHISHRNWHFLTLDGFKIYRGKKWMTFESYVTLHAKSLLWLKLQESVNQWLQWLILERVRKFELTRQDIVIHLFIRARQEWWHSACHLIQDDTECPKVSEGSWLCVS